MVVCALLAVAGNVLLVHAVKAVDLSVLGPINAYKSVIGLVLGIFLIGERPTAMGVAGTLLIIAGSYFVVDDPVNEPRRHAFVRFFRERGIQLRLAALGLSATEAIFLKKAILLSSPLTTFVLWSVLGFPIAGAAVVLLLRNTVRDEVVVFRRHSRTYLWLVVTTGLMQLSTVLTFDKLHVGYSLALFQLSTLDQRVPRLSVFPGGSDSEAAVRIRRDGGGRGPDRGVREPDAERPRIDLGAPSSPLRRDSVRISGRTMTLETMIMPTPKSESCRPRNWLQLPRVRLLPYRRPVLQGAPSFPLSARDSPPATERSTSSIRPNGTVICRRCPPPESMRRRARTHVSSRSVAGKRRTCAKVTSIRTPCSR